ncbi:hypothetical protein DFJ77DRAFT_455002 [Powellomyces hirtus]|nr:hypothetical protein DFJ77DRAFT_455002 [Powellomyces hirtus]
MQGSSNTPNPNRSQFPRGPNAAQHFLHTPQADRQQQSPAGAYYTPYESFSARKPQQYAQQGGSAMNHPLPSAFRQDPASSAARQPQQYMPFSQQHHSNYNASQFPLSTSPGHRDNGTGNANGYQQQKEVDQQQQGQEEQQFVPSFLTDALLSSRKTGRGQSSPRRTSGSWSSTSPGGAPPAQHHRSLSRTPPSSPGFGHQFVGSPGHENHTSHSYGSPNSSPSKSARHHAISEDDLPPTRSLFADDADYFDQAGSSPSNGPVGSPGSQHLRGSPGFAGREGSPARRRFSNASDVSSIDDSRIPRSSSPLPSPILSSSPASIGSTTSSNNMSAPDTPSPTPLPTVVTISGVVSELVDVLVEELGKHGRIVTHKKGKNWVAIRFADQSSMRGAMSLDNRLWQDCLLTVKMGDTLNALGPDSKQQRHRAPISRPAQPPSKGPAPSAPVPIPGASRKTLSIQEIRTDSNKNTRYNQPPAHHLPPPRNKEPEQAERPSDDDGNGPVASQSDKSAADAKKTISPADGKPIQSQKRPREETETDEASSLPPSRRTMSANSSPGSKNKTRVKPKQDDDDDDVIVKPAGFLATLSDWVFGW